jgi:hypothetical protein
VPKHEWEGLIPDAWRGNCCKLQYLQRNANEDSMANEDRHCTFCGEKIVWNEEFSMENGEAEARERM